MSYPASYATATTDQTRTLFGQVMWLVALATGCFALGCYAGRDLSFGWSIAWLKRIREPLRLTARLKC